jgi:hypothetical protein
MSQHNPLLRRDDGTEIKGLKRCITCGLSETYWERFPVCERPKSSDKPSNHDEGQRAAVEE